MSHYVWYWLDSLHRRSQVWFFHQHVQNNFFSIFYFIFPTIRGEKAKTCEAIWCRHQFSLRCQNGPPRKVEAKKNICQNPLSLLFSLSRSPNAAALQGTSCGQGRHCKGGLCVPKILPQEGGGDSAVSGETFWESFPPVTSTAATSTVATSPSTSEPGRVVYFPKTLDICQFFAQFGITLNICQRWHIN